MTRSANVGPQGGSQSQGTADTASPIVIAGGGLAGLSLAVQLVQRDVTRPITILEPRNTYTDDRTWCFWKTDPHPFEASVTQQWSRWRIATERGTLTRESARYPYCRLPSGAFYTAAVETLNHAPNVTLRRGTRVRDIWHEAGGDLAVVTEDREVFRAGLVFDGRPPAPGSWPLRDHPFLWQDFLGWRVEGRPGTFAPETVDLMDFRHGPDEALRFLYILPFNDREALVETTAFTQRPPGHSEHRRQLTAALDERVGHPVAITASEQGRIPMTSAPPPPSPLANLIPIGTRAGAPRPSTGYAFLAIQRHTAALARAVAEGRPGPLPVRAGWVRWLDRVFLTRLLANPAQAPDLFHQMFAGVDSERMVRFLSEHGGPRDHLAVMAALPTMPFLSAAWVARPGLRAPRAA